MEKPVLYACSLCKLEFPSAKMRYAQDGKKLICIECFNKVYKKKQQEQVAIKEKQSYEYSKPNSTSGTVLNKPLLVICTHCKYKFHYKANFKPFCPYCGKSSLRKYEEFTAQKILNDSAKGDF
ncbi:hypothetical protein HYW19_02225 [Candidatus Woesearchaeota archaeon]|nr:hypothetical protein [Candidatus Woesearchaeota archaeon]